MVVVASWTTRPNLSTPDELLDIALPHRNRWSHAQLSFIPFAPILEYLTSPAPRLEKFYLAAHRHNMTQMEPIDLFGGDAPSLQDVLVLGTRIVLGSEVFRGLRKLCLDSINGGLISADQVLATLSANPGLELLAIEDVTVTRLPPSFARTPVQLPDLKKIIFEEICVEAVGNILPFIRAPNCDSFRLEAFHESDDPFDAIDFLDQSFGHFDAFIHFTLAFHGSSQLYLYSERIEWVCEGPTSDTPPCFSFEIPAKMNQSIHWISQLLGSEPLRSAHQLKMTFKLQQVDAENFAGLKTLALLPSVQTFNMDLTFSTVGTILDLLGNANTHARGRAFPCLKMFRLEGTYGRPLRDLETMLMHRYGESGRGGTGPPPMRIILAPPFAWQLRGSPGTRLKFEDLRKIRTTHGVESVTLTSPFGPEGGPAFIYDDAEHEYCNSL